MNYRNDLKAVLEFWLKNGMDYKNGGIYTCLDREGKIYGTDKSVWFQGRALWTFSKAYNVIEKNEEYIKAAKSLFEFLPKCTDTDGRMFFTVTADGRKLQKRRYFFSETFAAIGCAEYYKATGDKAALEMAEAYYSTAYKCYTGEIRTEPKINPEAQQLKSHSPVMIMLSTSQAMRSIPELREKYEPLAKRFLDELMDSGFLTDNGFVENIGMNGELVDSPTGRIVNPGHCMETAWFVMSEGLLTGNKGAIEFGRRIIDVMYPIGWDKENGGMISFNDISNKPPLQLEWDMKLWWPQCETMIAARLAYLLFGDEKYKTMYEDAKSYCERYFIDTERGEWYGYLHYDNTVSTTLKGNIFKGPFHIPRMLIIMAILDETGSMLEYFI
ncbi:MAG: AGE family epimerase/isomerase [Clostridia bacterium]|nr:AGE family epimerase/isomerase [Clostridia bacterium]